MPYVEGFGTWPFGEEWLWEAIATSYLPLLDVLDAPPGQGHALASRPCSPTSSRRRARWSAAWRSCARCGPRRTRSTPTTRPVARARVLRGALRGGRRRAGAPRRPDRRLRAARQLDVAPPPTPCCRCWPPTPACACSWRPGSPRTARASAPGTAASGCPSARTRRGSTGCSRRPACTSPASTGPTSRRSREPRSAREAGVLLVPLDRDGDRPRLARARLPVARRLPRHAPADAARATPSGPTTATPYDPERGARARPRARRARLRGASPTARRRRLRHRALRPPLARGRDVPGARCSSCADVVPRRVRRRRRRAGRGRRRRAGAPARDLRTWSRRASSRGRQRSAELRRARHRRRPPRALRELLALQSSDWAFLIANATRGRLPARARRRRTTRRSTRHLPEKADRELRNLAPELANWAFVQP